MKTIIVGYDGSPGAQRALSRAGDVARAFSAHLVVISVTEPMPMTTPFSLGATQPELGPLSPLSSMPVVGTPARNDEAGTSEVEVLASGRLEEARHQIGDRCPDAEFIAAVGNPAEQLLSAAEQREADLIVLGSREHGFLDRFLVRPVDEVVARHTHHDLLLVH
ncbi:MAG: universal stress protein [Solirubrobacteraceae bacterium]